MTTRRTFLRVAALTAVSGAVAGTGFPRNIMAERGLPTYNAQTNPLAAGTRITAVVQAVRSAGGTPREQATRLHARLRVGVTGGLRQDTAADDSRPPRTAEETLAQGGDCSEMAFVMLACATQLGIPCRARLLHFQGDPPYQEHLVAQFQLGGTWTDCDPQAASLGAPSRPVEREIAQSTPAQAQGYYHREWGNYFARARSSGNAITAFERALALNPDDAYCHHRLAGLLERRGSPGDMAEAARHDAEAARLDPGNPQYQRVAVTADFNTSLRRGQEEYQAGFSARQGGDTEAADEHFEQCISHFEAALAHPRGQALDAAGRAQIERFLGECRRLRSQ